MDLKTNMAWFENVKQKFEDLSKKAKEAKKAEIQSTQKATEALKTTVAPGPDAGKEGQKIERLETSPILKENFELSKFEGAKKAPENGVFRVVGGVDATPFKKTFVPTEDYRIACLGIQNALSIGLFDAQTVAWIKRNGKAINKIASFPHLNELKASWQNVVKEIGKDGIFGASGVLNMLLAFLRCKSAYPQLLGLCKKEKVTIDKLAGLDINLPSRNCISLVLGQSIQKMEERFVQVEGVRSGGGGKKKTSELDETEQNETSELDETEQNETSELDDNKKEKATGLDSTDEKKASGLDVTEERQVSVLDELETKKPGEMGGVVLPKIGESGDLVTKELTDLDEINLPQESESYDIELKSETDLLEDELTKISEFNNEMLRKSRELENDILMKSSEIQEMVPLVVSELNIIKGSELLQVDQNKLIQNSKLLGEFRRKIQELNDFSRQRLSDIENEIFSRIAEIKEGDTKISTEIQENINKTEIELQSLLKRILSDYIKMDERGFSDFFTNFEKQITALKADINKKLTDILIEKRKKLTELEASEGNKTVD